MLLRNPQVTYNSTGNLKFHKLLSNPQSTGKSTLLRNPRDTLISTGKTKNPQVTQNPHENPQATKKSRSVKDDTPITTKDCKRQRETRENEMRMLWDEDAEG